MYISSPVYPSLWEGRRIRLWWRRN